MSLLYINIKNIIKDILVNNNINCSVRYDMIYKYAMGYKHKSNEIVFNDYLIQGYYKLLPELSEEQVILIMACHEIGHYIDRKDNITTDKLEREIMAWNYGKQFVPNELIGFYDKLNKNNIDRIKSKE